MAVAKTDAQGEGNAIIRGGAKESVALNIHSGKRGEKLPLLFGWMRRGVWAVGGDHYAVARVPLVAPLRGVFLSRDDL